MKHLEEKHIKDMQVVLNRADLLNRLPKNGVVAELGVDTGRFSAQIMEIAFPKRLYLIDPWDTERYNTLKMLAVKERFKKEIDDKRVIIIRQRDEEALRDFGRNTFDWVYIDTYHDYWNTRTELELCRLKVKKGGIIAGHDYTQGNIVNGAKYGVVEAVHHFCVKQNWKFILLTHEEGRHLSFALKEIV